MSVSSFRSFLYGLARFLGDVQAGQQAAKRKSLQPVVKRLERRIVGRLVGKAMRSLIR